MTILSKKYTDALFREPSKQCFRRALTRVNKSEDDVELERGREKRRIVEKVGTSFFQKNKKIYQMSRSDEQIRRADQTSR